MERKLRDVLAKKGHEIITVAPDTLVRAAVRTMNDRHIGSVLVCRGDELLGVFTERDVLRRIVEERQSPDHTLVREVMTRNPTTVDPDQTVGQTMRLMTERRVRHLPVVEGGRLIGLVSIGDLTWWVSRELREEITDLHRYIHGPAIESNAEV